MGVLLKKVDGSYDLVSFEEHDRIKKRINAENIEHIRRKWYRVHGRVKIESDHEVGLYDREGFLAAPLICSADQIDRFKKLEGKTIKPLTAFATTDNLGYIVYIPHIKN